MSAHDSSPTADRLRPVTDGPGILRFSEPAPGVVAVAGEVDIATAQLLEERLVERQGPIRLNMEAVTFIDSSGIRALVHVFRHCEGDGCTFRVEACSPPVERVLQVVGLYDLLTGQEDGHS